MDNEITSTIDNGESEVQLATLGTVIGTGIDGKPVEQNLTEESLEKLAEKHKGDEILVDADHSSELGGETEAKGWLSGLFVKKGVGLFGKIKWTDIGRKLIENRVFRWLSPSWLLDKNTKEPVEMTSVALTNKPSQAGRIEPIVNSAPVELYTETITMEMTKEELVQLIKDTIADLKKEEAIEKVEDAIQSENDIHEEVVEDLEAEKTAIENGVVQNSEPAMNSCAETETATTNECSEVDSQVESINETEEKDDDDTVEEEKDAEQVSEKVEEKVEEVVEEKKEEVIPLEALNSAPKTDGIDIVKGGTATWQKLSGQDFIDWVNGGMK